MAKLLPLYFLLGGVIVSLVTYFGSQGKGAVAAFVALLPTISVVTLVTIYLGGGQPAALSYARNLLVLLPPWILYVGAIIVLLPRIGLVGSLASGIALYLAASLLIIRML